MTSLDQKLQGFGVSLHQAILGQLVGQIETAIASGEVRSEDGKHSVYDFIRVILTAKTPRQVWKRFVENDPDCVTFCDAMKFTRKDGRTGYQDSPASDLAGLIYIAYMGGGDYSQKLRRSSAVLIANDRRSFGFKSEAKPDDRIPDLEALLEKSIDLHQGFPVTLAMMHKASGIVNKSQVKAAIKRDLVEGKDYIETEDGTLCISLSMFYNLMVSFKPLNGSDTSGLPEILPIVTDAYFQYKKRQQMNTRLGRRDRPCPGQIPLCF